MLQDVAPGKSAFQAPSSAFEFGIFMKMLIQWIICTDQPFTVAEHPLFHALMSYIKPDLATSKGFSDATIHRQILLMFAEERRKAYELMQVSDIQLNVQGIIISNLVASFLSSFRL